MQEDQASTTAVLVALCRSIATADTELGKVCQDRFARRMLPGWLRRVAECLPPETSRALSLGLVDHVALRTALIDDAVEAAFESGVQQLVLLGAGLDARAHRLPLPTECLVFEVDHPATLVLKQAKVKRHAMDDSAVRYAGCDFHGVTLAEALTGAGHDRTQPSMWIWEGVTMYLQPPAVFASMRTIDALSAPGSHLAVSYVTPDLTLDGGVLGVQAVGALRLLSEPVLCMLRPEAFAERWRAAGWTVVNEDTPVETSQRFGIALSRSAAMLPDARVLVVRKS